MKKLNENTKLIISEGVASLLGLLTFIFLFIPAYFESGKPDMSLFQIALGDERIQASGLLIFAFVMVLIGLIAMISLLILLILKKSNPIITTALSITGAVLLLAGAITMTCGIFISGLDKLNSSLGFTQGNWGIRPGNILVPIFALLSTAASYPAGMIILHHLDLRDKERAKANQK